MYEHVSFEGFTVYHFKKWRSIGNIEKEADDKSTPDGQRPERCMKTFPIAGSLPRLGELPVSKKSSWTGKPMAAYGGYSRTAA
jgi:hypothetical protein